MFSWYAFRAKRGGSLASMYLSCAAVVAMALIGFSTTPPPLEVLGQEAKNENDEWPVTRIIRLQHNSANQLMGTIQELFDEIRVAADGSSNSLIVQGSKEVIEDIEQLVSQLDVPPEQPKPLPNAYRIPQALPHGVPALVPQGPYGSDFGRPKVYAPAYSDVYGSAEGASIAGEVAKLEEQTIAAAQDFRKRRDELESDEREQLTMKIRELVEQSFDKRHQLQSLQLKELEKRMAKVQQSLARHQELRERIIEKRIDDLLGGDELRWDPMGYSGANPFGSSAVPRYSNEVPSSPYTPPSYDPAAREPVEVAPRGR